MQVFKKLKAFFYICYKSVTSVKYYKEIIHADYRLSIKYFISLAILASVAGTIISSVEIVPRINSYINNIILQAKNVYPQDLTFKIENNEWSINRPEPYIIPFWNPVDTQTEDSKIPKNLTVFFKDGTVDDLQTFDTWSLVNSKNIIVKDTNSIQTFPLKDMPNGEINKETFSSFIDKMSFILRLIPFFAVIILSLVIFGYYLVFGSLMLTLSSLLAWLVVLLMRISASYKHALKISAHTITLPILMEIIISFSSLFFYVPAIFRIPWFPITNFALTTIVLIILKKDLNTKETNN